MSKHSSRGTIRVNAGWQWPEPEYPEGRDPSSLFSDAVIDDLLRCTGAPRDFPRRTELQKELWDLATKYVAIGLTTPLGIPYGPEDVTLSKRAMWLRAHVLKPCATLIDALANRSMFSDWPDDVPKLPPDRLILLKELNKLREWADRLMPDLSYRIGDRSNHTREFETELVFELTGVFRRYFPNEQVTRGTYHRGHGMKGRFPDFIRAAARPIL